MSSRTTFALLVVLGLAGCATATHQAAQDEQVATPNDLATAAKQITAETAHAHLARLADDAMMGRATARPEIWDAAHYIAEQFASLGLEPMDEDGDYLTEYTVTLLHMTVDDVRIVAEVNGERIEFECGKDFAITPVQQPPLLTPLVLTPMTDVDWIRTHEELIPDGSFVLTQFQEATPGIEGQLRQAGWLLNVQEAGAGATGFVLPPMVPPEAMSMIASQMAKEAAVGSIINRPFVMLTASAVDRLLEAAGRGEIDVASLTAPEQVPVSLTITMPVTTSTFTAPNVVARLPGRRGGELKDVVLTAHFDHEPPGMPNAAGDSIYNGSDDNASGTVGLLEAARAFAALPTAPARSVVFAAVSGEEMGLLGSAHLAEVGPAPAERTAANLNMDMLSRNASDSLLVFAQTYSSLGDVFRSVLDAHPDLGLNVRPGLQMPESDLIRMSDQASYLERGVPVLFFNSGMHPELHTPDDEIDLADADKVARAARLMFLLTYAVANDPQDPTFTAEGRARAEGMQKMRMRQTRSGYPE